MKCRLSLLACFAIGVVLVVVRLCYSGSTEPDKKFSVTRWDAFGYYLYTPAVLVYDDYKELRWLDSVDRVYNVSGGDGMPVIALENGNKVDKYFCGVAIMQAPLFEAAHVYAEAAGYRADGFSEPYQYALAFGVILYCILALCLLRAILLRYYGDGVVALTLLLLCLATNFVQYAAVDNGLSHAYIFPLYVLVIYATIKWHERPSVMRALAVGTIVGLATICRPTELIMFLIPLLWSTHSKESAREKWRMVRANRVHIFYAVGGALLGMLPQLLYWKAVTGSFVYDVGSKWVFLNPWFRVIMGWEKGWFIYTPATLLFVIGLFFIKRYAFRYSVLVFCLLNIWIVISWDEWQYGASYAARALVQSYPVFALPLAAVTDRIFAKRWRFALYTLSAYLIGVNLFQIYQYNRTVLHYNDMNRMYYGHIYLDAHPEPIEMSLLDTKEWVGDEDAYEKLNLVQDSTKRELRFSAGGASELASLPLPILNGNKKLWLKVQVQLAVPFTNWKSWVVAKVRSGEQVKEQRIRLSNPIGNETGDYAFYMEVPEGNGRSMLSLGIASDFDFAGVIKKVEIDLLQRL
jgi:putative effector of murein hydrolase LrgA (UPF0299 family)